MGGSETNPGNDPLPVIDISPLVLGTSDQATVASQIGSACRDHGFFYIVGHGVDPDLEGRLAELSRRFFNQDEETKLKIRMALGGRAWRGYFPVGSELTSGKPDIKEGLYFGAELAEDDPRTRAGLPLHGRNLFPSELPSFRETVLAYIEAMTFLGHAVMRGIALSLGLEPTYFADRYMSDPLILFRIFHYPPVPPSATLDPRWGVGEHTDYGVLTLLKQDHAGGLQVKSKARWIEALPIPNSFVCNIGDMLDHMTSGLYRSTPHRVRNASTQGRLSFPFFFDPGFDAEMHPIELHGVGRPADDKDTRWDRASVHEFKGTYGDYVLAKVSKVFPELRHDVL